MKALFVSILLFCSLNALAQGSEDPYFFVKNFELKSVVVEGAQAVITVKHGETLGSVPRFELIAGPACSLSDPARCYGTVVRLDDSLTTGKPRESVFTVDLSALYFPRGVVLTVYGPNSQKITVRY